MKKKLFAGLLALCMVLSLMPMAALADKPDVTVVNEYDGIEITKAVITEDSSTGFVVPEGSTSGVQITGVAMQIHVSYDKPNAMAGMAVTYALDGETGVSIPVAVEYDKDDETKAKWTDFTDDDWNNGDVIADCTSYVATIPAGASDVTLTVDGLTYWEYDEGSKKLSITGSGNMPAFGTTSGAGHPDAVGDDAGKGSRYASFPWHKYQLQITSAEFEDNITSIGAHCFRKHIRLKSIDFPKKLQMVMNYGVGDCSALETADLSECTELSTLWVPAFSGMASPSVITVANADIYALFFSANHISKGTTVDYEGKVEFTSGVWTVTAIGDDICKIVSYSGTDESEVEIPASFEHEDKTYTVKELGDFLFQNNKTIKTLTFEAGSQCERIGKRVFAGEGVNKGTSFESITLPDTIKEIGEYAFYSCENLTSLPNLPENLETIGQYAFHTYARKNATTSLTIPESVTSIGDNAFRTCYKVKHVTVLSPKLTIGKSAFSYANYKSIDLTAVKKLTLADGAVFDMDKGTAMSHIYVADEAMAEEIVDHIRYEIPNKDNEENCRPACIVVTNGGKIDENSLENNTVADLKRDGYVLAGLNTEADGSGNEYNDMENIPNGTIFYAQWIKEIGETGYSVYAILDQTYIGKAITPDVIVMNNDEVVDKEDYEVEYRNNIDAGVATAVVSIEGAEDDIEVNFNIVQDPAPKVLIADKTVTYGEDYTMTATAKTSAGNDITGDDIIEIKYYTNAACTKDESTEAPTDAGIYYAKATLTETNNYAEASAVAVLTINKADFTVSGEGYNGVYDGEGHSITVNGEDGVDVLYYVEDEWVEENPEYTDVGTYTVRFKASKTNYNDYEGELTVVITPAPLTVKYVSEIIHFNQTPALEVSYSGFVNGEDENVLDKKPTVEAPAFLFPTLYILTPEGGEDNNYVLTYESGYLIVLESPYIEPEEPTDPPAEEEEEEDDEPVYRIKIDAGRHGDVTTKPSGASEGTTITIYVEPDKGYALDELVVTDREGNELELKDMGDGRYRFRMPDSKVNIEAGFKKAKEEVKIVLTVGSNIATVNGETITTDVAPVIVNGRTMLPIRFIAEALGAEVEWVETERKVIITKGDTNIVIFIDSDYAYINGEAVKLDAAAFIEGNRTYLPLRFVAEALGADVVWDADARTVTVSGIK